MDSARANHPPGAELQTDTAPADWIAPRVLPWGRDVGFHVCALVPTGYDAYVRVFHHVDEPDGEIWVRRRWSEIAERSGRRMHPAVQFERFASPHRPSGELDQDEATALVAVLRACTSPPERYWMAIWEGYAELSPGGSAMNVMWEPGLRGRLRRLMSGTRRSIPIEPPDGLTAAPKVTLPARAYYLYRAPIDVLPRFEFHAGHLLPPNMWWPDDKSWFVATEIDFDSTLVGCSRDCASALLASDLEALEVSPDTRLDLGGDTVND